MSARRHYPYVVVVGAPGFYNHLTIVSRHVDQYAAERAARRTLGEVSTAWATDTPGKGSVVLDIRNRHRLLGNTKCSPLGIELLRRAREVLELDLETGGPQVHEYEDHEGKTQTYQMPQWMTKSDWLTWEKLCAIVDEDRDRCSSCGADFEMGSVVEDKCPDCGAEGFMCAGFYIRLWGGEDWVNYP